ncbi:hypothetical protein [Alkalihalobacterium bogoriense]|uniref:hypothetical protein n=1 Tax=Alkalihalobacterium bogoriense TaxID=246272 RepID=UPI00047AD81F|nr:hypothetical protein [Alkalihalobacterium bogoriense]
MKESNFLEWTRNKYRRYRDFSGTDVNSLYFFLEDQAIMGNIWRLVDMDDLQHGERFLIRHMFRKYLERQFPETKEEEMLLANLIVREGSIANGK